MGRPLLLRRRGRGLKPCRRIERASPHARDECSERADQRALIHGGSTGGASSGSSTHGNRASHSRSIADSTAGSSAARHATARSTLWLDVETGRPGSPQGDGRTVQVVIAAGTLGRGSARPLRSQQHAPWQPGPHAQRWPPRLLSAAFHETASARGASNGQPETKAHAAKQRNEDRNDLL
jgi:hypothetical protein